MKLALPFVLLLTLSLKSFGQEQRISTVPFELEWIDQPQSFSIRGDQLEIIAGANTDLYAFVDGSYYINNAPKVLFKPDSNFVFSVKIKPDFKSLYDGGAILVYTDSSNWAKVLFEKHDDGTTGLGVSLVRDKRGDDSYHPIQKADAVFVKVARSGMIFNFYYSMDGKSWKLLRTFPYQKVDELKIGFYAQSPKGEACTVLFSDIRYKGEKFKDFFAGE